MTTKELMDRFFSSRMIDTREQRLFARILLLQLSNSYHELRLADGQRLNDNLDFSAALRELADAAVPGVPALRRPLQSPACSDCDHEHEGKTECGKYLGEGKFCHCESKVPA